MKASLLKCLTSYHIWNQEQRIQGIASECFLSLEAYKLYFREKKTSTVHQGTAGKEQKICQDKQIIHIINQWLAQSLISTLFLGSHKDFDGLTLYIELLWGR